MALDRARFLDLLRSIFEAQEREISCSEFFDRLPRYVDLVVTSERRDRPNAEAGQVMPDVAHHIRQCRECGEAYEALLEVVRSDE